VVEFIFVCYPNTLSDQMSPSAPSKVEIQNWIPLPCIAYHIKTLPHLRKRYTDTTGDEIYTSSWE